MKKKIIFIIAIIIIAIIVGEIYVSKNNEKANNEIQKNETENISVENEVSKNDVEENNSNKENTSLNKTNETKNNTSNSSNSGNQGESATKVKKQVAPSGFMGSSMYRVSLYENGDVYVVTYDGTGYEEGNITSKDLIAKKATSIEKIEDGEFEGGVRVKSNNPVNEDFGWIEFSK